MTYSKHKLIYDAFKIADISALLLGALFAAWIAFSQLSHVPLLEFLSIRMKVSNFLALLVLLLFYLTVFEKLKLYHPQRLDSKTSKQIIDLGKAVGFNTLLFAAAGHLFDFYLFSPLFLAILWPTTTLLTYLCRRLTRHLLARIHLGDRNERSVIIVGNNATAGRYAQMIHADRDLGYHLLGFVGDSAPAEMTDATVISSYDDFPGFLGENVVDEIVISVPLHEYSDAVHRIIKHAEARGIQTRFPLSQLFDTVLQEDSLWRARCAQALMAESGSIQPEIVVHSGFQVDWRFIFKRVMDTLAALALLLLISPLILLVALLIKLDSPGPVFFVQKRHGYNGRLFDLYKFRTMVTNAEELLAELREKHNEMDGAAFKMKNDPRVTRLGRWLRRTSIDELPQLINVVKGDMSLVGPRPLSTSDYKLITNVADLRRFSVLPGITCYWQISGRNQLSFNEWMKLDLEYIDNYRLLNDFKILLKTIPAVLKGTGAS